MFLLCVSSVLVIIILIVVLTKGKTSSKRSAPGSAARGLDPYSDAGSVCDYYGSGGTSLSQAESNRVSTELHRGISGGEVLCSEKTGTLTKNELTVEVPRLIGNTTASDIFLAALAAKREGGNQDAIDKCITEMAVKTQSLMHTRKRTLSPSIRKSSVQMLLFATKVLAKRSK